MTLGNLPKAAGLGQPPIPDVVTGCCDLSDAGEVGHRYAHSLVDPRGQEDTTRVGHIVEEDMEHGGTLCDLSASYAYRAGQVNRHRPAMATASSAFTGSAITPTPCSTD
jgi:hypothetical protein